MKTSVPAAGLYGFSLRVVVAVFFCLVLHVTHGAGAIEKSGQPKGLYVRNGTLMREGKAYAGIGANYDTLFGRLLRDKDDSSSLTNLGRLAKKGIPFVRFRAGGF